MKRKLLVIFMLLVAMFGTMAFATACTNEPEDTTAVAGDEVGEYYCDLNGNEYLLTLTDKCEYTLVLGDDPITGSYVPKGEEITFTIDEIAYSATYFNNVITLSYDSVTYKFIRKINYTISFETDGGTAIDALQVRNGRKATKPDTIPEKTNGDVFVGWYTDSSLKSPYDWNEAVTTDFTLYARFVSPIEPEFTVKFNVDGDESVYAAIPTVGHKVFNLPTPEDKDGNAFVGWWVSAYEDAAKLTYKYEEQELSQNATLYAVWASDAPIVSVEEKTISWTPIGSNNTYTIVVKNVTTNEEAYRGTTTMLTYGYNFSAQAAGEYEITVQANNKVGTAYYINRALAKVSVFEVVGGTLLFNKVDFAEKYLIYVECGTPNHHSEPVEILATAGAAYDFSECEMKDGKLIFKVVAEANGYLSSESEEYVVTRTLDAVTGIAVDADTQMLGWSEVANATSYTVVIKQGDDILFADDVTTGTELPLKAYGKGTLDISVTPKARGWSSPEATTYQYNKTTISAPSNVHANVADSTIEWDAVAGADHYEVKIGDADYVTANDTKIDFVGVTGVTVYDIYVRAIAENAAENSLESDKLTVRNGELGDEIRYQNGVISWDPVFGIETYYFSVQFEEDDAIREEYTNIYKLNVKEYFTQSGTYTFSLRSSASGESVTVAVRVYELSFDTQGADETIPSQFLAVGDKVVLPGANSLKQFGFTLDNWYTVADGGQIYNDSVYLDEKDRTLYAHWNPMVFHVSLNIGAYGVSTDELEAGVDAEYRGRVQLPVPVSNDPAKGFAGWYDSATGEIAYTAADGIIGSYFQGGDITLYAKWVDVLVFTAIRDGNNNVTGYQVSKSPDVNLTNLTVLHIPEKYNGVYVTEIIDFTNIATLEVIEIPDSIRFISIATTESAFTGCDKLTAVKIYSTSFTGEKYYSDDNGVLIYDNPNTGRRELKFYPKVRPGDSYDIPDGVQVLPANVIWDTKNLLSLTIPASVTLIETKAIGYTNPWHYGDDVALTTIAFRAAVGGADEVPLEIHESAFYNTRDIVNLTLPSRLNDLNFYFMFGDNYPDSDSRFTPNNLESLTFVGAGGTYQSTPDGSVIKSIGGAAYELVFYPGDVEEFVLPAGYMITSIGESAVRGNTTLTSIEIPSYVTNIGAYAFYGCSNVATLTFLGGAGDLGLTIGEYAFYSVGGSGYSGKIESLELPGNLKSLGSSSFGNTGIKTVTLNSGATISDGAFADSYGSTTVTTLVIGPDVKDINFKAVFGASINNITIDENNPYYAKDSDSNIIYTVDFTEIVWLDVTALGSTFEIRDGVKRIGANAFATIGYSDPKPSFSTVIIPASVEFIGNNAFSQYSSSTLTTVTFAMPEEGTERAPLTFGDSVFKGCAGLTSFTFPEGTVSIGKEMFKGCTSLTEVHFPESLGYIGTIPESITTTSYGTTNRTMAEFGMFTDRGYGYDGISVLTVAEGNKHYKAIDNVLYLLREVTNAQGDKEYVADELLYAAPNSSVTAIEIPNTVGYIWNRAFYAASSSYPNNVQTVSFSSDTLAPRYDSEGNEMASALRIGEEAFKYATNLTSVSLPTGTVIICDSAFYSTTKLTKISLPVGTVSIGASAFNSAGLTSIEIPYTVTSIYEGAFSNSKLSKVTFAETPEGVEEVALRFEDSASEYSGNGVFYYCSNLYDFDLVLPERTTYIGRNSFGGSSMKLASVYIPAAVTEIARYAFVSSNIPIVTIGEDSQLLRIGHAAFRDSGITSFVLPASVTYVGDQAFSSCTKLTSFTIEDNSNLVTLGDGSASVVSAFSGDSALVSFSFGTGGKLTYLYDGLFNGCTSLTEIVIPASVEEIREKAFRGSGITSVEFEEGSKLHIIGKQAFSGVPLESFTFPDVEQEILLNSKVFEDCTSLTTVHISASVHNLNGAFEGCTGIKSVTVAEENPSYYADDAFLKSKTTEDTILVFGKITGRYEIAAGASQIAASAFEGQTAITEIFIPKSVMRIGNAAFRNCENLVKVEFETGSALNTIGFNAFYGCTSLSNIDFTKTPQLVTLSVNGTNSYAPSNTFADCTSLETIDFSKTRITTIPSATFAGCTALTTLKLPRTLMTIVSQTGYGSYSTVFGNTQITDLDLSNTAITSIPQKLFSGSTTLKTIKLPYTLAGIETSAFENCTALLAIDFTGFGALTEIGANAFKGCTSLATVKLSSATRTLKAGVFHGCTALESIDLSFLTSVEARAFYGTGLKKITLPGSVTTWGKDSSSDSYYSSIYSSDGVFGNCAQLKEVVFAYSMTASTTFEKYMFYQCTALDTITFQSGCGVTELASYMFQNCTSLESVTLPESITSFSNSSYLFSGCTNLTEVDFSKTQATTFSSYSYIIDKCKNIETFKFPENLTEIPSSFFDGCTKLTSVTIPDSVYRINSSAFRGCSSLQQITLPASLKAEGYYEAIASNAFQNCTALLSIVLPAGLQDAVGSYSTYYALGSSAFKGCTALQSVVFEAGASTAKIPSDCFSDCTSLKTINLPDTITMIDSNAFLNCGLTTIEIPANVTLIGNNAFSGCALLSATVACGDVVNSTSSWSAATPTNVFKNCVKLMTVEFTGALTTIGESWFEGCTSLLSVDLGDNVTTLGKTAFKNCEKLNDIDVSEVKNFGENVFEGCEAIFSNAEMWKDGVFYLGTAMAAFDDDKIAAVNGKVTIKDKVTAIPAKFFSGSKELKEIVLPASLKSIGDEAFSGCTALATVTGLGTSEVKAIPQYAFKGCTALKSFTVPAGITELATHSFDGAGLTAITIPSTVTTIGTYAFANCDSLASANVQGGTQIPNYAFQKDVLLSSVTLAEGIKTIGTSAFEGCVKLASIDLSNITTLNGSAFKGCEKLASIVSLNASLTMIDKNTFEGTAFVTIDWLTNVAAIGNGAFKDCLSLTTVTLPAALKNNTSSYSTNGFGTGVFEGCTSLNSVTFTTGILITTIPASAFKGCTALASITLPSSITSIGASSFEGTGITAVDCSNFTTIGNNAFKGTRLASVTLSANLTDYVSGYYGDTGFGTGVFSGCTLLTSVTIPSGAKLTKIPENSFNGCTLLSTINFPASIAQIGKNAFTNCTSLTSVDLSATTALYYIYDSAFEGCTNLSSVQLPATTTNYYIYIKPYVFKGCTSLKTLSLPQKVSLDNGFLNGCSLDLLEIPGNVSIYARYLTGATIKAVKFVDGTTEIDQGYGDIDAIFAESIGLEKIIFPAGVEYVKSDVFFEDGESKIPEGVKICFVDSEEDVQAAFEARKTGSWDAFLATLPADAEIEYGYVETAAGD